MDHARFWSVIDAARVARGRTASALVKALAKLPPDEIVSFDAWFSGYYLALDRQDLWAAVSAIRGGCGDDAFDGFRSWLISRGEAAIVAAVRDPESLAQLIGKADPRDERLLDAARVAYEEVAHAKLPEQRAAAIPAASWPPDRFAAGVRWDPAFYAANYPKLHARFVEPIERTPEPTGSISEERFWDIIAAARAGTASVADATGKLANDLHRLAVEELVGFHRWLSAYNHALMRGELALACRVLLGKTDADTVAGFRGWVIAQGAAAVRAAVHDCDAILEHATHPPAACFEFIFVADRALTARHLSRTYLEEEERERIPERDAWPADWASRTPTVSELRDHFPRLTAGRTDVELAGPVAPAPPRAPERDASKPAPIRVRHPKFGEGTVVSEDRGGTEPKLVIDFADGRKTIARRFVEVLG